MGFSGNITPQGGGSNVDNTLFVDAEFGDDISGQRENPAKPYKTIQEAIDNAVTEDKIIVNGAFTIVAGIVVPINTHLVFDFLEGSSVTGDLADELINGANATTASYEIHGRGTFRNNTVIATSATRALGGKMEIFGAKSISSGAGQMVSGGGWKNIRNVDEFYTENGTIMSYFTNVERDGLSGGFIENVLFGKIGHAGFSTNGILTSAGILVADEYLIINNCQFVQSSLGGLSCLLASTANPFFKIKVSNSRFIGHQRQRVINLQSDNRASFNNCYFESNADLSNVNINASAIGHFTDCQFKSNGTATTIFLTADGVVYFHGTNQHETVLGSKTIGGVSEDDYYNTGVLLLNKAPQIIGHQYWDFTGISEPPTIGDSFTITANDGNFITASVVGADNQNAILEKLRAAWLAKGAEPLENDFTHFTPLVVGAIGTQFLRGLATDVDHNYDVEQNEVWTWITSGAEPINVPNGTNDTGASIIGGEVNIDANLIVY